MTTHPSHPLLSARSSLVPASPIRRIFELGKTLADPIDFSIGQPDFPVPEAIKRAAVEAISHDRNGYSVTAGVPELRARLTEFLQADLGWGFAGAGGGADGAAVTVTSGTSGALLSAFACLLNPGDEAVIPDPYFVSYPVWASLYGAKAVLCDTYPDARPDFKMTAERVERVLSPRTRLVLLNSPSNPAGTVLSERECRDLLDLCRAKNLILVSDEIYDEFTYADARTQRVDAMASRPGGAMRCPSPARFPGASEHVLLVRGFGKSYGVTGWRLGYAAGPGWLIEAMTRMQQYTFVCAPTPLQAGAVAALGTDLSPIVAEYAERRALVVGALGAVTTVPAIGGAFYAFPKVPERLGLTATELCERAAKQGLLVVPGCAFSARDTHLRLSFAAPVEKLRRGVGMLAGMMDWRG